MCFWCIDFWLNIWRWLIAILTSAQLRRKSTKTASDTANWLQRKMWWCLEFAGKVPPVINLSQSRMSFPMTELARHPAQTTIRQGNMSPLRIDMLLSSTTRYLARLSVSITHRLAYTANYLFIFFLLDNQVLKPLTSYLTQWLSQIK